MCATTWKSGIEPKGRGRGRRAKWHLCAICRFQHQKETRLKVDGNIRKLQRGGFIKKRVDPSDGGPGFPNFKIFSCDWPGLSAHNRNCCACATHDGDRGTSFRKIKASWHGTTPQEREVQVFRRCLICFLPCFMGDVGQRTGMLMRPNDPHNRPECLW